MSVRRFDAILVWAGQAGPSLAVRLAGAGMTVAVVERHLVGGTCVNTGCMPTETLVAGRPRRSPRRRLRRPAAGPGRDRHAGGLGSGRRRVPRCAGGQRALAGGDRSGDADPRPRRFEDADTLRVGEERIVAPWVFLNVSGRAIVPDMPGIRDVSVMTNTDTSKAHFATKRYQTVARLANST